MYTLLLLIFSISSNDIQQIQIEHLTKQTCNLLSNDIIDKVNFADKVYNEPDPLQDAIDKLEKVNNTTYDFKVNHSHNIMARCIRTVKQ